MPRFVRRHAAASARGVLAHLAGRFVATGAQLWRTVLVGAMLMLTATWLARGWPPRRLCWPKKKSRSWARRKKSSSRSPCCRPTPKRSKRWKTFACAVRKAAWDKAFSQIEKLISEQTVGLVPSSGGLHVPLRAAVAVDLAALPPGGQDAYRLFHDAEAKKLWEELQKESGQEEMTKLSRLATLDSDHLGRRSGGQSSGGRAVRARRPVGRRRRLAADFELSPRQQPAQSATADEDRHRPGRRRPLDRAGRRRAAN